MAPSGAVAVAELLARFASVPKRLLLAILRAQKGPAPLRCWWFGQGDGPAQDVLRLDSKQLFEVENDGG